MQKWEYRRLLLSPLSDENTDILNDMGNDGWELVDVAVVPLDAGKQASVFYFKRPKP